MHPELLKSTVQICRDYMEASDCHGEAPRVERLIDAAPQPCKTCHGDGCTNEGDPEIGNAYFECTACGGTGRAKA